MHVDDVCSYQWACSAGSGKAKQTKCTAIGGDDGPDAARQADSLNKH